LQGHAGFDLHGKSISFREETVATTMMTSTAGDARAIADMRRISQAGVAGDRRRADPSAHLAVINGELAIRDTLTRWACPSSLPGRL